MDLLDDNDIRSLSELLRQNAADEKYLVSDLVLSQDGKTLQFVDLVMEGGGTLGIALVGYIYALEQAGIRFLSVGGSSVGAIVALLLSCLGSRTEEKGAALTQLISDMDMSSFIDGNVFARALSKLLGSGKAGKKKLRLILFAVLSSRSLIKKLGLNPGDNFLKWLTECLEKSGCCTMKDARKVIEYVPDEMVHRIHGKSFAKPSASLKIVAADITTSSKAIFPEMAPLYWEDTDTINPAYFARASMSIPAFFQPMEVYGISEISDVSDKWKNLCSFEGEIPDKITFTDGGLLSNFPISIFHKLRVPNAPTFGARLGSYPRVVNEVSTIGDYAGKLFEALSHYADFEFIYKNPDYSRLITYIPTSGHSWLNFHMSGEEKRELFLSGMNAAYEFLETFDWLSYKAIRREQLALDLSLARYRKVKS